MRGQCFGRVGTYPDIALMEDIAISKALKKIGPPIALAERVVASGRRFETKGVWRLILLMWRLRLAYLLCAPPHDLGRPYRYFPPPPLAPRQPPLSPRARRRGSA